MTISDTDYETCDSGTSSNVSDSGSTDSRQQYGIEPQVHSIASKKKKNAEKNKKKDGTKTKVLHVTFA